ncbi:terminase [Neisseria arctica]|uniref:Terminase n=1 Tax=Neisseria arctica TaxID=1470200 RepID=A0A0J0YSX1_9NEIS|nr:terminase small subunit [Neisseria arctica]KLT73209.1 terminase [Neisseria arctica]UOO87055.1 terminase small subunit [Neisseria arctica]
MTPKQEQFARLYIETGNTTEAYRRAYSTENMKPETITNEAYKLLQSPDISAMIDDLKAEHKARHCVTVDDVIAELEQARQAALSTPTPQSGAAVSATMGKAKILGLIVDKAEIKAEAELHSRKIEPPLESPLSKEELGKVITMSSGDLSTITLADLQAVTGDSNEKLYWAIVTIISIKKIT